MTRVIARRPLLTYNVGEVHANVLEEGPSWQDPCPRGGWFTF